MATSIQDAATLLLSSTCRFLTYHGRGRGTRTRGEPARATAWSLVRLPIPTARKGPPMSLQANRRRGAITAAVVTAVTVASLSLTASLATPAAAATLADILAHQTLGTRPAHSGDQLGRYANLVYNYAGLTDAQIGAFFNDSSFGVLTGQVERIDRPRSDVTIVRDRATGVPHITGTTRAGTMYGAGYAGAQDRLWVMDLLRRVGRGQLSSYAGGSPGNRALEQSVWRNSPYTEADLQAQVDRLRQQGSRGAQLFEDVQNYVAGINAYIAACMAARNCPGEYVLTGHLDAVTNAGGPEPFKQTDLIAVGGVIG